MQDCGISSGLALEIPQAFIKPPIWCQWAQGTYTWGLIWNETIQQTRNNNGSGTLLGNWSKKKVPLISWQNVLSIKILMLLLGNGMCIVSVLTHWGRVKHICVSKHTIIGSDNGLSPGRRQAIIWTNVGILLIGTLGKNFSEILFQIRIFSFKKMGLNVSSVKWRPFCLGLNMLT